MRHYKVQVTLKRAHAITLKRIGLRCRVIYMSIDTPVCDFPYTCM